MSRTLELKENVHYQEEKGVWNLNHKLDQIEATALNIFAKWLPEVWSILQVGHGAQHSHTESVHVWHFSTTQIKFKFGLDAITTLTLLNTGCPLPGMLSHKRWIHGLDQVVQLKLFYIQTSRELAISLMSSYSILTKCKQSHNYISKNIKGSSCTCRAGPIFLKSDFKWVHAHNCQMNSSRHLEIEECAFYYLPRSWVSLFQQWQLSFTEIFLFYSISIWPHVGMIKLNCL